MRPRDDRPEYLNVLDLDARILWLCGVAGAGKSSVAVSVAKVLREMGLLGSLYGFQVAKQAALNPTNLFSTIARHLAQHKTLWMERLVKIIRDSDELTQTSVSPKEQFERFLLGLLGPNGEQTIVEPTVIIIDAFDECGTISSRRETLKVLARCARELPAGIRILITSRFDEDVQKELNSWRENICLLKMEQIPEPSTRHDIHAYVHHTLKDVDGLGAPHIASELTQLALAAEQSFQWASTACLFIMNDEDGNATLSPEKRLQQVLTSKTGLDPLYRMILNQHFGSIEHDARLAPQVHQIILGYLVYSQEPISLHTIVCLAANPTHTPNTKPNLEEYHRLARKLSSLVTGTQDVMTPLVSLHTSFTDFLQNPTRSETYFVDPRAFNTSLAVGCLEVMLSELQFNICRLPTSFQSNDKIENIKDLIQDNISDQLYYACCFWAYHLSQLDGWAESVSFSQPVSLVLNGHVLEWLEVMSLIGASAHDTLQLLSPLPKVNYSYRCLESSSTNSNYIILGKLSIFSHR